MRRVGAAGLIRAERTVRVNDEERTAWIALALGIAVLALLDAAFELRLDGMVGVVGAAAGYGAWRLLPRRPPPGARRYWRGRPYD